MSRFSFHITFFFLAGFLSAARAQVPDFSGLKVMINPGHGGHDSDDRGMTNGFWESEGNLTKGLWLRDLLEARGCEVIMSRVLNRTEDDLPLSQIAAIANQNEVSLFISIHSNAGNQSSNFPLTIFNGKSESPVNPESKVWARQLWEQLITNRATYWTNETPHYMGDLTLNPDWTSGYGVLYPLLVPGIISEGSFHDYRPEMDRLLNLEYRKQEAYNMLYATVSYFGLEGVESFGNISGIIRDSLLTKTNYSIAGSPDKFHNVDRALVELLETGEFYRVDTFQTGFYLFDSIAPGNYHLVFSAPDYFNDTIPVEVTSHRFSYVNHWMIADKTMAPKIILHTPLEGALTPCFDPIAFTFNMNMDSASVAEAFHIEPEIQGSFSWDRSYLNVFFQPEVPYETGTVYTASLDTIAEHQWGVNLDSGLTFTFVTDTRNRFLLESSFPMEGQQTVSPFLQFRLVFDAPLNNTSLIQAVSIQAGDGASFSTLGATILTLEQKGHFYFSPSDDLEYNTDYTLALAGTIQDERNIPLVEPINIHFRTMEDPGVITVLDEFENVDQWNIDLNESRGVDQGSFLYRWKKDFLSGDASMLFRYQFLLNDAECIIKPLESIALMDGLPDIGMWIWGDLSHHSILLGFNHEEETALCQVDFAGWNYVTSAIPEGADTLRYIRVVRSDAGPESGDLYFDALHQPGSTLAVPENDKPLVRLYPNPVMGSEIYLKGVPEGPLRYTIYDVSGSLIQEGALAPGHSSIRLSEGVKGPQLFMIHISNQETACSILFHKAQ